MSDDPVSVDAEAIPEELKERDQWLVWDKQAPRKQPYTAANGHVGSPASWNDPDDWATFEEALEVVENKATAGLGYVFAKTNDEYLRGLYGGLDLDGCIAENGTEDWLPSLQKFFDEDAYMEFSPSGDGIHVPLVGFEPPEWWGNVSLEDREHEGVEAYGSKFFTFTGDTLKGCGESVGEIDPETVNEWLAEAYENITGEDPREVHGEQSSTSSTETRETRRSREEVEDLSTTTDFEDVLDAVDHLEPRDLPLRSSKTGEEPSGIESWDPAYRQSKSGQSLKYSPDSGMFWDMSDFDGNTVPAFGPLDLFAAEQGIIRSPTTRLEGEDWTEAVNQAREHGAPIPEYVEGQLSEVTDAVDDPGDVEFTDARVWEIWSEERTSGELDEDSIIPAAALRHIIEREELYDLEKVPDDDSLPDLAHNRALRWLDRVWGPEELGIEEDDDEEVTRRRQRTLTPETVYTWDDVRERYKDNNRAGRFAAVKLLRDRYDFLVPADTEELHIYNEDLGVFELGAGYEVGRELDRNLRSHYSQHEKKEIVGRLREAVVEREDLEATEYEDHLICVENGVLNVDERELYDHSPEYKFTTYLPVRFDPDAECPKIEEFLGDITRREEDKQTLFEVLGNCLLPNYEYEYITFLFGGGANGKSTWLNVVRELLGDENTSSVDLQKLAENRFATARLLGKWANICEELPEKKLHNTSTLKNLSGGGDIAAEKKGQDGFDFSNRAKLIFAANNPPVIADRSHAMARRLVPIYLPYKFTDDPNDEHKDRQYGLVDDLTTEEELSGLLNAALDGLERLRETGDVSLPESQSERLELYERHSDHIKKFRVDCLTNEGGKRLTKDEVYNAYTAFCTADDREPVAKSTFWKQLRKTSLDVTIRRVDQNGDRVRMVENTAFTDIGSEFAPDYSDVEEETEVDTLSSLAPGDEAVVLEGEVEEVQTETPPQIAEKAVFTDETDSVEVVVWSDANQPALEIGQAYRLKNVKAGEYEGEKNIEVSSRSGVEKIAAGTGHAPAADPGENKQIETAADGGTEAGREADQLKKQVKDLLRTEYGPAADVSVAGVAGADAIYASPDQVATVLDDLAIKDGLLEQLEDGYRLNR